MNYNRDTLQILARRLNLRPTPKCHTNLFISIRLLFFDCIWHDYCFLTVSIHRLSSRRSAQTLWHYCLPPLHIFHWHPLLVLLLVRGYCNTLGIINGRDGDIVALVRWIRFAGRAGIAVLFGLGLEETSAISCCCLHCLRSSVHVHCTRIVIVLIAQSISRFQGTTVDVENEK